MKQITRTETKEVIPAWSPDGKSIAYKIRERRSIGLYSIEDGNSSEFSYGDGIQGSPVWAPDGKLLTVDWKKIYCYDLTDKSDPVFDYTPPKEAGAFFSWSKDKRKMLFFHSSYFGNTGLKVASPNGGPSFEPVHLLTNWGTARWSDNSKLMAVQGEDDNGEIAISVLPLTGGESSVINLDNLVEGKPFPFSFSINSGKLIFTIERGDGKEDLYAVPFSAQNARTTGPAVKIFDGWYREGAYNIDFSLSPDGEKAALIQNGDIWIAFTNGDNPIKIPERGSYVRWTDNGKALLINASGWILIENPGPQGRMIELRDDGKEIECRWANIDISPDNSQFAVLSDDQIKIIPVEESKSSQVYDISGLELKQCNYPAWSPDGKNLAFIGMKENDDPVSFPDGRYHIYKVPIDGGKPVRVAPEDNYTKYELSWSPDGNWIAYSVNKEVKVRPSSTIWEVDFEEIVEKLSE
jgi:Tol biopolymer transport system component